MALAAAIGGRTWLASGILPAVPVMERSIGILAGRIAAPAAPGLSPSAADALLATQLAARTFRAGDVGHFEELMTLGARANLAENFAAAEQAYRAALAVQQTALGRENPDTVDPLMDLALQVSDEGRFVEAGALFGRAESLVQKANDRGAPARLLHYRGLHALNQGDDGAAFALFQHAATAYRELIPPERLRPQPASVQTGPLPANAGESLTADPIVQSALIGLIEVERYEAIVLRRMGRINESARAIEGAQDLAAQNCMLLPVVTARLIRTAATSAGSAGRVEEEEAELSHSETAFIEVLPQTRPVAETILLRAAALIRRGQIASALPLCLSATTLLRKLRSGTRPALLAPCLDAYAVEARRNPAEAQSSLARMFEAAELSQDSNTARQIAEAAARLAVNARDPKIAQAIRRRQDAEQHLSELYRERDNLAHASIPGTVAQSSVQVAPAELDKRIAEEQANLADADAALQAAAPNYGQLVQAVVPADAVLKALRPKEAFVAITLAGKRGWVFGFRDGKIQAAPVAITQARVRTLVSRIRASIEPGDQGLPKFDTGAAFALYEGVLAPVESTLNGAAALTVAPSGALLSIPFAVLLTGPGNSASLQTAPWLIRQFPISHVPSPANFVALRHIATTSRATKPWFGFGDFHPVSLVQAEHTFPHGACADSARLLADLPPLPFARRELAAARELFGASPADEKLGASFTVPAVEQADLAEYRVLHFATHAILPSELRCLSEPAIVTSPPPGAASASQALLNTDNILGLKLDADLVILSACNSGGPGESHGGESLSGLARAFFFAGARALLVTHWSISDQTSAFLIADTVRRFIAGNDRGLEGSLRAAELGMLEGAGKTLPAALSHPFFWAPFALIGEGLGQQPVASPARNQAALD